MNKDFKGDYHNGDRLNYNTQSFSPISTYYYTTS